MTDVKNIASELRGYAEHFEQRDWEYTRELGDLKGIVYNDDAETLPNRVRSAFGWIAGEHDNILRLFHDDLSRLHLWKARFSMVLHVLHKDSHLPDGVLDNGGIITFWEETGEYLQYVQPSVGSLIADFMESDPFHPSAIALAEEMERIQRAYAERLVDAGLTSDNESASL